MNNNLLDGFLSNFETEFRHRQKLDKSDADQLVSMETIFRNYITEHSILVIQNIKFIKNPNPFLNFRFSNDTDIDIVISVFEKMLIELGIQYRKNRFFKSLPLFSIANNTIPGLPEGRGYSMIKFSDSIDNSAVYARVECLRENQIIKILDSRLDGLMLTWWNGNSMSRCTFKPKRIDYIKLADINGIVKIPVISNRKNKNIEIVAEFQVSHSNSFTLKNILSVNPI